MKILTIAALQQTSRRLSFLYFVSAIQDSLGINKLKQLQEKPKFTNWYIFISPLCSFECLLNIGYD